MMMLILLIDKQVSALDVFDINFSLRGFRAWSLDDILIDFFSFLFFSSVVVWEGGLGANA